MRSCESTCLRVEADEVGEVHEVLETSWKQGCIRDVHRRGRGRRDNKPVVLHENHGLSSLLVLVS
ncbi:MAG: hypothetical protein UY77_C0041G0007 [Candidatus Uhrbacteria bacterium GW2011_GWA2_53_10]|uniref:Uncharacterized protein n=1 Tax=Candidatus Uhrbacteria bacterium GW2011_GWA2_53_10 TaxID=1618980 RepID=A0A0G1XKX3_9BACT|nr:MAG: hypothetical protein UY77_C0041G0007 [Candidatus Uhrbacteria bacterium GW2011_GWA2_53_10]